MKKSSMALAVVALAALGASTAFAGSAQQQEQRLVKAQNELTVAAGTTHGAPQAQYLQERAKVDQLIQKLRSGKPVDPKEIDAALWSAKTAP